MREHKAYTPTEFEEMQAKRNPSPTPHPDICICSSCIIGRLIATVKDEQGKNMQMKMDHWKYLDEANGKLGEAERENKKLKESVRLAVRIADSKSAEIERLKKDIDCLERIREQTESSRYKP